MECVVSPRPAYLALSAGWRLEWRGVTGMLCITPSVVSSPTAAGTSCSTCPSDVETPAQAMLNSALSLQLQHQQPGGAEGAPGGPEEGHAGGGGGQGEDCTPPSALLTSDQYGGEPRVSHGQSVSKWIVQ